MWSQGHGRKTRVWKETEIGCVAGCRDGVVGVVLRC